jgi:PAS domain S-box-containing protein
MTRVLAIDDIKENLYFLEVLLKGYGYEIQTAFNGADAFSKAKENSPDVIISDILMPIMDGFTFCIQCKNDTQLKQIPFIFYTATYTDPKDEAFALSLGADAFFEKPIEPLELVNKIGEVIAKHAEKKVEQAVKENKLVQEVDLKEYNEILIHKLEKKMVQLDITNRELLESESRFRRLAENSPVLIFRISLPEKRVTFINSIVTKITGYSPEEFYQNQALIDKYLLVPSGQDHFVEPINRLVEDPIPPYYEYQIRHKSGEIKWVQLRIAVVKNDEGQPTSIEGIIIDQTESYLSKQALEESEKRFRSIIENSDVGYFFIDTKGYIRDVNPAWLNLYRYDLAGEVLGHFYSELQVAEDMERAEKIAKGIISGDPQSQSGEFSRKCKDGTIGYQTFSIRPVTQSGKVIGYEGFIIDTTARKLAEDAIRNMNIELEERVKERTAQLESTNRELEAFSYSVSHDLRAPLRTLDGFSKILLSEHASQLDETGQHYLNRIVAASQHMKQLIDDLLNLSQVVRLELNISRINLSEMAEKIIAGLEDIPSGRKIEWDIAAGVIVNGDRRLLEIALQNLLNNAYKFTSSHLTAHIEFDKHEENGQTVYYVRDDGVGFDMNSSNKLFDPFQRLPSALAFEGTGIGLTIVQRIINRHGGRIWAEAAINQGATFYFTLG